MIKLYYAPGACSLAPHVALRWAEADFEAVRADRGDPAYLSINPSNAVPALDTGEGFILTQAGAVLHYLARRFPTSGLAGSDAPRAQAEIDRWSAFLSGDMHPAFFPMFMPGRYTTAKDKAAQDAVREAGALLVRKQIKILDDHLAGDDHSAGRAHIVGETWTYVDVYALPMLRWASAKLPDGLAAYPNAMALLDRLHALPAVQETLRVEGLS